MGKTQTGIQELSDGLVKACRQHKSLKALSEKEVLGLVDILLREQFSRTDGPVRKRLSELVQDVVDRLFEEEKHAN